jgi:DNA replication licensing factor MCM7
MTDVKPLIQVATYTCDVCGFEVYQDVKGDSFTPLRECVSSTCKTNQSKGACVCTGVFALGARA